MLEKGTEKWQQFDFEQRGHFLAEASWITKIYTGAIFLGGGSDEVSEALLLAVAVYPPPHTHTHYAQLVYKQILQVFYACSSKETKSFWNLLTMHGNG